MNVEEMRQDLDEWSDRLEELTPESIGAMFRNEDHFLDWFLAHSLVIKLGNGIPELQSALARYSAACNSVKQYYYKP